MKKENLEGMKELCRRSSAATVAIRLHVEWSQDERRRAHDHGNQVGRRKAAHVQEPGGCIAEKKKPAGRRAFLDYRIGKFSIAQECARCVQVPQSTAKRKPMPRSESISNTLTAMNGLSGFQSLNCGVDYASTVTKALGVKLVRDLKLFETFLL